MIQNLRDIIMEIHVNIGNAAQLGCVSNVILTNSNETLKQSIYYYLCLRNTLIMFHFQVAYSLLVSQSKIEHKSQM